MGTHADIAENLEIFRNSCREKDSAIEKLQQEADGLRQKVAELRQKWTAAIQERDQARQLEHAASLRTENLAAWADRLSQELKSVRKSKKAARPKPKASPAPAPLKSQRYVNAPGWARMLGRA